MKKKTIIISTIIGASAFVAMAPVAYKLSKNNDNQIEEEKVDFDESTDACDELFSNGLESIKAGKLKKAEQEDEILEPQIGRQVAVDSTTGKIAIRFVAAISSLNVDATWTKALYNPDGTVSNKITAGEVEATTAYRRLAYYENDELKYLDASQEVYDGYPAGSYKYFVTYTLKISNPSLYENYTIDVSLKLTTNTETIISKTAACNTDSEA